MLNQRIFMLDKDVETMNEELAKLQSDTLSTILNKYLTIHCSETEEDLINELIAWK